MGSKHARKRTVASARSIRKVKKQTTHQATQDGKARVRWMSTWPPPSAQNATSCSSRRLPRPSKTSQNRSTPPRTGRNRDQPQLRAPEHGATREELEFKDKCFNHPGVVVTASSGDAATRIACRNLQPPRPATRGIAI